MMERDRRLTGHTRGQTVREMCFILSDINSQPIFLLLSIADKAGGSRGVCYEQCMVHRKDAVMLWSSIE